MHAAGSTCLLLSTLSLNMHLSNLQVSGDLASCLHALRTGLYPAGLMGSHSLRTDEQPIRQPLFALSLAHRGPELVSSLNIAVLPAACRA